jgi:hypothetical protein
MHRSPLRQPTSKLPPRGKASDPAPVRRAKDLARASALENIGMNRQEMMAHFEDQPRVLSPLRRIKVKLGRKTYVVVRDDLCVLRIEYTDAVMGKCHLDFTGRVAQQLRKAHPDVFAVAEA